MSNLLKNREDADRLLNVLLPHAQELLEKYDEFYPFGASLDEQGNVAMIGAYDGNEHPKSMDLMDLLTKSFSSGKTFRAGAICANVTVNGKDAIRIGIETTVGDAVDIFLTYQKTKEGYEYGELAATQRESTFNL